MLTLIIIVVAVAALVLTVARFFTDENVKVKSVIQALLIGLGIGLMNNYLIPLHPKISWLFLLIIFLFIGALCYQWSRQGSEFKEFACFAVLTVIVGLVGVAAAAANNHFVTMALAMIVPIIAIGYYAYTGLKFHRDRNRSWDDEAEKYVNADGAKKFIYLMAVTLVVTGLCAIFAAKWAYALSAERFSAQTQASSGSLVTEVEAADGNSGIEDDADIETEAEASDWHYYNNDVQGGDEADDFNFGPRPDADTATEYDADFRERLRNDPALGAADMAWFDANAGTRYLGEFYESCKGDWAKTINTSKEAFIDDPELYNETLEAFFKMLDACEVSLISGNDMEDQMYMNPYTVDGIPDVIVMKTPDHTGTYLTYTLTVKETGKVKVSYRVECGYQPTNVEEVMNITPQPTPDKPNKPSKPDKPDKPDPEPDPEPDPKPDPKPKKDPSERPSKNTEPNDDKGPGEKTIGDDKDHSTKDTKDSSTSGSYDDYKKNVDNLKDTNKNQKTGSDSNKPSTPTPSKDTKVDNNGDKGNVNKPTPKKEAETVKNDPPADHMDEPS